MQNRKYKSWTEAHVALILIKPRITNTYQYAIFHKLNPRLLANPQVYPGFPGWERYLGIYRYERVEDASRAVRKIPQIVDPISYSLFHHLDPRLPPLPQKYYKNFLGWEIFLFGRNSVYGTWQEASIATIALDVIYRYQYKYNFKRDSKLPRHPKITYPDFPDWDIFLGKK